MIMIRMIESNELSNSEKNLWRSVYNIKSFNVIPMCGFKVVRILKTWEHAELAAKTFRKLLRHAELNESILRDLDKLTEITGSSEYTEIFLDMWNCDRERSRKEAAERRAEAFRHEHAKENAAMLKKVDIDFLRALYINGYCEYADHEQHKTDREYSKNKALMDVFLMGYIQAKNEC